ncbi:ABC transporter permease [Streptomyces sp. ISL-96]|nr:ABC transporter permease [Streptomyces sp. ISL-96]
MRGPRWALLRIHRTALRAALAFVVLAAAVTGFLRWAASAFPMKEIGCSRGGPCSETFLGFASAETLLTEYMKNGSTAVLLLPLLVGAFIAGPVVGRELESGLHRLAWTQSVSPARWLASKLAVAATLAVAGTLALMGIFRLGVSGLLGQSDLHWPDRGVYEALGPALVAYVLLAVAVGALIGLLVRRTLLAMSITGVVTGAVLLVLGNVRWNLIPSLTVTGPRTSEPFGGMQVPVDSFMTDIGEQNAAGERFDLHRCVPDQISTGFCPTDLKATNWYVDFHPYSHFWYVQLIETGIVLALTAAATYAAFRVLRRSTA